MRQLIFVILLCNLATGAFAQNKKIKHSITLIEQNIASEHDINQVKKKWRFKRRFRARDSSYMLLNTWYNLTTEIKSFRRIDLSKKSLDEKKRLLDDRKLLLDQVDSLNIHCYKFYQSRKYKKRLEKWGLCGSIFSYYGSFETDYLKHKTNYLEDANDKKDSLLSAKNTLNDSIDSKKKELDQQLMNVSNEMHDIAREWLAQKIFDKYPCLFRVTTDKRNRKDLRIEIMFGGDKDYNLNRLPGNLIDTSKCDEDILSTGAYSYNYDPGDYFAYSEESHLAGKFLTELIEFFDTATVFGEKLFKLSDMNIWIEGGADALLFKKEKHYSGEFGPRLRAKYTAKFEDNVIGKRNKVIVDRQVLSNEDLAFLRAYAVFYSYRSKVSKSKVFISDTYKLQPTFSTHESSDTGGTYRYCVVRIDINGAYNILLLKNEKKKKALEIQRKEGMDRLYYDFYNTFGYYWDDK